MDKLENLFGGFGDAYREAARKRKNDRTAWIADLGSFVLAFFFARCHIAFGAYPLGFAFLAALPDGVLIAGAGCALGALTKGSAGVIYAVAAAALILLRLIVSGGRLRENLILRMSTAVIAGFLTALYESIRFGLSVAGAVYGMAMIVLTPLLTFVFAGAFDAGISVRDLFIDGDRLFPDAAEGREKLTRVLFYTAILAFIFFGTLSCKAYGLFGISLGYMVAAAVTVFTAKRFGVLYGAVVGFVSALAISAEYAAGFALAGAVLGLMFPFGAGYAVIGGAAVIAGWGYLTDGIVGLLTALPEFVSAAVLMLPVCRKVKGHKAEVTEEKRHPTTASDMVGTMALAYQGRQTSSTERAEVALGEIVTAMRRYGDVTAGPDADECRGIFLDVLSACGCGVPADGHPIFRRVYRGERLSTQDTAFLPAGDRIATLYNARLQAYYDKQSGGASMRSAADGIAYIGQILHEARMNDMCKQAQDDALSEKVGRLLMTYGLYDGAARVYGERERHLIIAGEDADGKKMTAPAFRRALEEAIDGKLGTPEYYRRGKTVLMECGTARRFCVDFAVATRAGRADEASGDSAICFIGEDDRFYAILSDGMGSGETARETSDLTVGFLHDLLGNGAGDAGILGLTNHLIRQRGQECAATVDLFSFDLIGGEAVFLKSGAAASYVKRGGSIFRIRSRTMPIGVMEKVDSERIRAEVAPGDTVLMFSDGIGGQCEDAAWLYELLGKPVRTDAATYANTLLNAAIRNNREKDDMTVIAIRIENVD